MLKSLQALAIALIAAPALAKTGPVKMRAATQEQILVIRQILGDGFVKGDGAGAPELQAADIDINGDGISDLITMQRGFCTNHTCDYEFYLKVGSGWRYLTTLENWGYVYLLPPTIGTMKRIVIFKHVTDDCMSCSPPEPVWVLWHDDRFTPGGALGDYIQGDVLTRGERSALEEPSTPE